MREMRKGGGDTPNKLPITLETDRQIANYELVSDDGNENLADVAAINAVSQLTNTDEHVQVRDNLSKDQLRQLLALLNANKAVFSINGELGFTDLTEHRIELEEGTKPFAEPLRRRALTQISETRRQVQHMLDNDIIEESESSWASAYVLAKKKMAKTSQCGYQEVGLSAAEYR